MFFFSNSYTCAPVVCLRSLISFICHIFSGLFRELLGFLKDDGCGSELSSDDLSFLSGLMSQREEIGQEHEAHSHKQADGPLITHATHGQQNFPKKYFQLMGKSKQTTCMYRYDVVVKKSCLKRLA